MVKSNAIFHNDDDEVLRWYVIDGYPNGEVFIAVDGIVRLIVMPGRPFQCASVFSQHMLQ